MTWGHFRYSRESTRHEVGSAGSMILSDESVQSLRRRAALFPAEFPRGLTREARELHDRCIVFDLHVDPLLQNCFFGYDLADRHDESWSPSRNWLAFKWIRDVQGRGMHRPSF